MFFIPCLEGAIDIGGDGIESDDGMITKIVGVLEAIGVDEVCHLQGDVTWQDEGRGI
jgi:hypothetical protein